jgi:3' exoribonuclease, RNase T-like
MKSIMLDLETLGTGVNATVISVGVVAFDPDEGVIASAGWAIRSEDWHGEMDASTVKWWMKQNEAAQAYSFSGTWTAEDVAVRFADFRSIWGGDECWANDPDFDVVLLKTWWARTQARSKLTLPRFPIKYNEGRSVRTMRAEANRLGISTDHVYSPSSVAHNPIDDAANQARLVNFIRNQLVRAAA